MEMNIELLPTILAVAALLLASVLASRASSRIGVPALLLFLGIGMLAGSDGPGGIHFDNPPLAQALGVVALAFILFGGGLSTHWAEVRPVAWPAATLATVGVVATAGLTGWFSSRVLGVSLLEGLLLGAIVSSTDAAAVFAVLRSRNVRLPDRLRSLLELESGSNDPMAVFLTVGVIGLLQNAQQPPSALLVSFLLQMGIGGVSGYLLGRAGAIAINRARLEYEGLYPAITLALVLAAYGLTDLAGGNGFLAVYVAGIVLRRADFIHKRSLVRFHDALAWLMQIAMFLTLGLQVFPSKLLGVAAAGAGISLFLMLVGRPLSVLALLPFWRFDRREQALIAWVGLRGAAPIILATFPLVARVPAAETIFHMVFFIVLLSTLVQGSSIPLMARLLGLSVPDAPPGTDPLDLVATGNRELLDLRVPEGTGVVGQRVLDLGLPQGTLVMLIERDGDSFVPSGGTKIRAGDRLVVLTARAALPGIRARLEGAAP
jgi:cell volume regulation protein A